MRITVRSSTMRKKSNAKGIAAALLVILFTAGWSLWHMKAQQQPSTTFQKDFSSIWNWCEDQLVGGSSEARWSFRWDGNMQLSAAQEVADQLDIKLKAASSTIYQGENEIGAGDNRLTIWIHSQADDRVDVVVLFEPEIGLPYNTIINEMSSVGRKIALLDQSIKGSFSMRGIPAKENAGERVAHKAGAKRLEAYNDGHTRSNTYFSSKLSTQVKSGKQWVNLQIAQTAASSSGDDGELVVGVPLITGDYVISN